MASFDEYSRTVPGFLVGVFYFVYNVRHLI
nr:MAG TPA: hypothetical protein [Caudoviricetes sp.]